MNLFSCLRRSKQKDILSISKKNVPQHIAIIPDGNGRWAKKRGLPRTAGHAAGIKRIREVIRESAILGVKVLTFYTFSTENWKRPENEVDYLMRAPLDFLKTDLLDLVQQNVRVQILGDRSTIPSYTQDALTQFERKTAQCTGLILNFAFNYGSRSEIVQAVRCLIKEVECGNIRKEEIDEDLLGQHLFTKNLPDPDLLVRTSGENRISNFLLWQIGYTELWFTDELWPDFTTKMFHAAIKDFQLRKRRYGAVEV